MTELEQEWICWHYGTVNHYVDLCWGDDPMGDWHGRNE